MRYLIASLVLTGLMFFGCGDTFDVSCERTHSCSSDSGGTDAGTGASDGSGGTDGEGGEGGAAGGTGGTQDTACLVKCTGNTPVCDEEAQECVGCLKGTDCAGDTSICDLDAQVCVGCLEATDCTDAGASLCASNSCAPCEVNDDCSHIDEKNLCDEGTCVECTAADESACGNNSCDPATNTCTGTPRGETGTCESCVADSECEADHFCVPMNYKGEARGGYCLKDVSGGCGKPFGIDIAGRTSLSSVSGKTYCGINEALATCEAVNALLADETCNADTECPEAGLCRKVGNLLGKRCTYKCSDVVECKNTPLPGSTCGAGTIPDPVTPDYCGGT